MSEFKRDFVPQKGKAAILDPNLEKELKKTHFVLKDKYSKDECKKNSNYRDNFKWKVNTYF